MQLKKDTPLKIDILTASDDDQFRLDSQVEILSILNGMAHRGVRCALYFDRGSRFILTTILGANEQGVWLEASRNPEENRLIEDSRRAVLCGSHYHAKVQFITSDIRTVRFGERTALLLPVPDIIHRIQRREYYRLLAPAEHPLRCVVPASAKPIRPERKSIIMDISGGGISLVCEENEADLKPGVVYEDCQIDLPEVGTIVAPIEVRNLFQATTTEGSTVKRAGCKFVSLDGRSSILLNQYITRVQALELQKKK